MLLWLDPGGCLALRNRQITFGIRDRLWLDPGGCLALGDRQITFGIKDRLWLDPSGCLALGDRQSIELRKSQVAFRIWWFRWSTLISTKRNILYGFVREFLYYSFGEFWKGFLLRYLRKINNLKNYIYFTYFENDFKEVLKNF